MMKQMMLSKHFGISVSETDEMTPFDLDFYYGKMQEFFDEQRKTMEKGKTTIR